MRTTLNPGGTAESSPGRKSVCQNRKLWEASGAHNRSLGFPGFPVDLVGVDGLHAVFSYGKQHTRLCPVQRGRKSGFARDDKFRFDTFVGLRKYGWKDSLRPKQHNALCHPNRPHPWKRSPPPCHPERTRMAHTGWWRPPGCMRFSLRKIAHAAPIRSREWAIRGSRGICCAPRMAPKASGFHTRSIGSGHGHPDLPNSDFFRSLFFFGAFQVCQVRDA